MTVAHEAIWSPYESAAIGIFSAIFLQWNWIKYSLFLIFSHWILFFSHCELFHTTIITKTNSHCNTGCEVTGEWAPNSINSGRPTADPRGDSDEGMVQGGQSLHGFQWHLSCLVCPHQEERGEFGCGHQWACYCDEGVEQHPEKLL